MIDGEVAYDSSMALYLRQNTSLNLILKTMLGKKAGAWAIPMGIIAWKMPGIIILLSRWCII